MDELKGKGPFGRQTHIPLQVIQRMMEHMALQGQLLDLGFYLFQLLMEQFFTQIVTVFPGQLLDFFQAQP